VPLHLVSQQPIIGRAFSITVFLVDRLNFLVVDFTITGTSFGSCSHHRRCRGRSRFIFIVFVSMLFVHGESDLRSWCIRLLLLLLLVG
jgi:hypothetical protein